MGSEVYLIISKRKPINKVPKTTEKTLNKSICRDRRIVEKFFGSLCTFGFFSHIWK